MIYHVLGAITLAADIIGGGWLTYYLVDVGRRPWSWQRKLPLPKVAEIASIDGDMFDVTGLY